MDCRWDSIWVNNPIHIISVIVAYLKLIGSEVVLPPASRNLKNMFEILCQYKPGSGRKISMVFVLTKEEVNTLQPMLKKLRRANDLIYPIIVVKDSGDDKGGDGQNHSGGDPDPLRSLGSDSQHSAIMPHVDPNSDEAVLRDRIRDRTKLARIIGQRSIHQFIEAAKEGIPVDWSRWKRRLPKTTHINAALVHSEGDRHSDARDIKVALAYAEVLRIDLGYGDFAAQDVKRPFRVKLKPELISQFTEVEPPQNDNQNFDFWGRPIPQPVFSDSPFQLSYAAMDTGKVLIIDAKEESPRTIFRAIVQSNRPVVLIKNAGYLKNALDPKFADSRDFDQNARRDMGAVEQARKLEIAGFLGVLESHLAYSALLLSDTDTNLGILTDAYPKFAELAGPRIPY